MEESEEPALVSKFSKVLQKFPRRSEFCVHFVRRDSSVGSASLFSFEQALQWLDSQSTVECLWNRAPFDQFDWSLSAEAMARRSSSASQFSTHEQDEQIPLPRNIILFNSFSSFLEFTKNKQSLLIGHRVCWCTLGFCQRIEREQLLGELLENCARF